MTSCRWKAVPAPPSRHNYEQIPDVVAETRLSEQTVFVTDFRHGQTLF
jgi:hypothetical protein